MSQFILFSDQMSSTHRSSSPEILSIRKKVSRYILFNSRTRRVKRYVLCSTFEGVTQRRFCMLSKRGKNLDLSLLQICFFINFALDWFPWNRYHLKGADIKSRLKVAPHIYREVSENTGLKKKLGSRLEIPCYAAFWQTLPLFHNPTAFAALRAAHKKLKVLRFWEK